MAGASRRKTGTVVPFDNLIYKLGDPWRQRLPAREVFFSVGDFFCVTISTSQGLGDFFFASFGKEPGSHLTVGNGPFNDRQDPPVFKRRRRRIRATTAVFTC